jgi:hypothetical protein
MIELLLPYRFDTLEYSWVKATIGIRTLADYFVAKKCQHRDVPEPAYSHCATSLQTLRHFSAASAPSSQPAAGGMPTPT